MMNAEKNVKSAKKLFKRKRIQGILETGQNIMFNDPLRATRSVGEYVAARQMQEVMPTDSVVCCGSALPTSTRLLPGARQGHTWQRHYHTRGEIVVYA
jgi:hypothetical protein